ncbi:MAG: hydantoinase B/oxoprolinase family protein, partial [Chloroflexi bacterium]|nr:hydantoinase B/oxoprolinase family protein [Chloroflexota bacterium]
MPVTPVPGSEIFSSRPVTPDELRTRISPKLQMHTVSQEAIDAVDPLTYEVLRHRLWSITEEMGEALKRMSGSIVVTDCNDFDFALTDELGQEVQIGLYNTELAASMDLAIFWTLQHRSENPGIDSGDMFLCNDPWVGGGIHQNDVSLFAPFFWEGKLFAWSSAVAHQVDIGGVAPGSWTPRSQDVFWESLPTPPVKIVRNYELQRDVEDVYLRRSRTPQIVGLDLRAKVGANTIAHNRLRALIERYGPDLVKAVMKRVMDDAERRLRAKLQKIPDGTWRATSYQEQAFTGDRGVYKISLAMTKKDDHLTFDFRGTDPQNGMINCTYSGMRGGITSVMLPILASDIPWAAGGLMRCFDIISEEGTLNNATFPAGVCKASVASAWATSNVVTECLSKMLDTSVDTRGTVISVCCGT